MTAVLQDRPRVPALVAPWPRALLALVAVLAITLLLFHAAAVAMVAIWLRSETFQHAFLVVPIALWLVWRLRDRVAALRPAPSPTWLIAIAFAAFAWLVGDLAEANAVTQLAFVALLVLAVPALLGTAVARLLMFPLGFLFFAVPLGEFTMPWLMARTADFTVLALQLSGIPVFREGQEFIIPSGSWSVVEACSGVRYLIASTMVGTLFAYLHYRSLRRRFAFVAIAIAIPVVANWVRAYLIVLLGHLSGNRLATGVDHLIYGWFFFALVMALMFFVGLRWSEPAAVALATEPAPRPPTRPAAGGSGAMFFGTAAVIAMLVAVPSQTLRLLDAGESTGTVRLANRAGFDFTAAGWRADPAARAWAPAFVDPSARLQRVYRAGDRAVGLSIDYYRAQGDGHKLVSSVNALVATSDKTWRQVDAGTLAIDVGGRRIEVRSAHLAGYPGVAGAGGAAGLRVWQLYWVDDELTGSDVAAKAWGALQRLRHGRDDGAAIVVSTPDDAAADATLGAFLRDNLGTIAAQLAAVRDAR